MERRSQSVTLQQATEASPTLARLAQLARESVARLTAVQPLIPATLRGAVKAGPLDATQWCLLLDNNAAAAKMRQLLPALEAHLRTKGWESRAIRLKVQDSRAR
ncbi:MAG: hypothetical protein R3E92_18150 [Burkholderiaceae bacterium]|nr:hypothetical protein [Rhodoferax sp.]MCZ4312400.1 hypothetical protein [Comamonadaceae bacterium G21597-S1]MCB2004829.1 hypothetical protein [Rhodoferax sp.]MCB2028975.1 hypothetical protein [Rhodoferax sp.]MCB2040778.1 hypothetical protein [Rhodoferax sp.]